jgi:RecA-family ATPase
MLKIEDIISNDPLPQVSDFLLYPWLLPGRLTLMVGPTNVGKTTLTLEIVSQLLKGDHLWDRYPAKKISKVLYLHGEHTIATLQEAAKARGDIPAETVKVIHEFGDNGSALLDPMGRVSPLFPALKQIVIDLQPELIIAEPISAFLGTSENDNREVRAVVSLLSSLGASVGAAVLTHHHVGKSHFDPEATKPEGIASGEARGAMAFEDAAERVLYLKRPSKKEGTHVKIETPKSKGFPVSPITVAFDEDTLTYSHVPQPLGERDLIAIYARRRKYPSEKIIDLIAHFRAAWNGASNTKILLMLRRAARVGLLTEVEIPESVKD